MVHFRRVINLFFLYFSGQYGHSAHDAHFTACSGFKANGRDMDNQFAGNRKHY